MNRLIVKHPERKGLRNFWTFIVAGCLSFGVFGGVSARERSGDEDSPRREFLLEKGWRFFKPAKPIALAEFAPVERDFDDSGWERVTVPHDWAISGPFDGNADLQNVAIVQDGETAPTLKAGRTGGLPYIGVGWYRVHFDAPTFDSNKVATLVFDGAMSHSQVFLNGKEIGGWAYGYNSFFIDATDCMMAKDNVLAVRLENKPLSSRWYPGAGLYRNVHVIVTDRVHVPVWGVRVTTPVVTSDFAEVNVAATVENIDKVNTRGLSFEIRIFDDRGLVDSGDASCAFVGYGVVEQKFTVRHPKLWSPDSPTVYRAEIAIVVDGKVKDRYSTTFGIRDLKIVPDRGMFLNGEQIRFRGVCNHHDLGPLGAAVSKPALRRQLTILKDMGCNAIRTSHNMPAPELVELCDEMGLMVMVEAFDEWDRAKCHNGYHLDFAEWAERDMVNMVRHYRNNPSVMMWSIGNEIPGQSTAEGARTARFLQDICHREDPTRKVTAGIDNPPGAMKSHFASTIDVPGFTYRLQYYQQAYDELSQRIVLGAETASTLSSRGVYHFPVEPTAGKVSDDSQCSSYDLGRASWSELPDDDFMQSDSYPWCIGEFVWTGFDYLGEPTPYGSHWPNHSSMFGIIDLAGMPKDRYYLYRSHWNPSVETLHILPHWTWPGREGETTPVFVYTNHPSAELFVNGKSMGRRTKDTSITEAETRTEEAQRGMLRQRRYRLMWMDVKYEPGSIRVVAYDASGKAVAEKEVHTAGKPHHLELSADRTELDADGKDLAFITVKVVDRDGNLCPDASSDITFNVKGAGRFVAAANGDPTNIEQFQLLHKHVFKGQLVAIVQSSEQAGAITFEARAKGLASGKLSVNSKGKRE